MSLVDRSFARDAENTATRTAQSVGEQGKTVGFVESEDNTPRTSLEALEKEWTTDGAAEIISMMKGVITQMEGFISEMRSVSESLSGFSAKIEIYNTEDPCEGEG